MSNKQVIAIFILGIALLLAAFWAGLSVTRDTEAGESGSSPIAETEPGDTLDSASRYIVQVASFGTREKADQLTSELKARKYLSAYTQSPRPESGDRLYRVIIGPYDTREAADLVATQLMSEGRRGIMILSGNSE